MILYIYRGMCISKNVISSCRHQQSMKSTAQVMPSQVLNEPMAHMFYVFILFVDLLTLWRNTGIVKNIKDLKFT